MHDINCPYCGAGQDINHDDGYEEDVTHQQQCSECDKYFTFTTSISYYYEAEKADCLNNGAEHEWKATHTYPKEFTKMRCTMCDEKRAKNITANVEYNQTKINNFISDVENEIETRKLNDNEISKKSH